MEQQRLEHRRDSGIELFRALAALMVVGAHVLTRGGMLAVAWGETPNALSGLTMRSLFVGAANCFAVASGYLLCHSRFRLKRFLRLWVMMFFYAAIFTGLRLIIEPQRVDWQEIASVFFPVTFQRQWYFSAYAGLFFLMPFVNRLLRSLSRQQHLALTVVAIVLFSGLTTLSMADPFGMDDRGNSTFWLLVLYILGAYVRMHGKVRRRRTYALWFVGSLAAAVLVRLTIAWVATPILGYKPDRGLFTRDISPLTMMIVVSLFLLCRGFTPKSRAVRSALTWLAPASFSVYVIHLQPILWDLADRQHAFRSFAHLSVFLFPLAVVGISLAIFVACILLDQLRVLLFKALRVERALDAVERRALALWGWALNKLQRVF